MGGRTSDDSINVFKVVTGGTGQSHSQMSSQQSLSVSKLGVCPRDAKTAITDGLRGVQGMLQVLTKTGAVLHYDALLRCDARLRP